MVHDGEFESTYRPPIQHAAVHDCAERAMAKPLLRDLELSYCHVSVGVACQHPRDLAKPSVDAQPPLVGDMHVRLLAVLAALHGRGGGVRRDGWRRR